MKIPRHNLDDHIIYERRQWPSVGPATQYPGDPLKPWEIRLLNTDERRLENASLNSEYECVSYCWDDDWTTVVINEQPYNVTHSVAGIIDSLHGRLWIDALCINQQDQEEKARQIALMSEIFNKATRVNIWLDEDVRAGMRCLRYLAIGAQHDQELPHLEALFKHRYWRRVWIVQEIVLAKELRLCHGSWWARRVPQLLRDVVGEASQKSASAANITYDQIKRRNSVSAQLLHLWAYFGVHACVHAWMAAVLDAEHDSSLAWAALECVASHVPQNREEHWSLLQRRLLDHANKCVRDASHDETDSAELAWAYGTFGRLYADQGKLWEAEEMYMRALRGCEKALGADHTSTLDTVNNLGLLYADQGKLGPAEEMYLRALRGKEKALGADHTSTLETVNNLGLLYKNQGKLTEAEEMLERALRGWEKALGTNHSSTITTVICLFQLRVDQHRLNEARALCERAKSDYSGISPSLQGYVDRLEQTILEVVGASDDSSDEGTDGGVRLQPPDSL